MRAGGNSRARDERSKGAERPPRSGGTAVRERSEAERSPRERQRPSQLPIELAERRAERSGARINIPERSEADLQSERIDALARALIVYLSEAKLILHESVNCD